MKRYVKSQINQETLVWLSKVLLAHGIRFVALMITVDLVPEKPKFV